MNLQDKIIREDIAIKFDGYAMSIGELTNLYQDKEIDIHPEFQRFYQRSPLQKTKLIESILLGIPLPPILVLQRQDGVWDIVDGWQRLSVIFQFMGILLNENNEIIEPLILEETKHFPFLTGKQWDAPDNPENSLTIPQRLSIKRTKFDVKIILEARNGVTKYELFRRLGTIGSSLSEQELRNCILMMENPLMFSWLSNLCKDENFQQCVALTDLATEEQYDLDLVLRFVAFRTLAAEALQWIGDINEFLTDRMLEIARHPDFDFDGEARAFTNTFRILNETIGSDCFHRYDLQKQRFLGGFLLSAFEAIALGVGYNYEAILKVVNDFDILERIKTLWADRNFLKLIDAGKITSVQTSKIVLLARKWFEP